MKINIQSIRNYLYRQSIRDIFIHFSVIYILFNMVYYLLIFNISSKPTGYFSAIKLAWMISNTSNCSDFEEANNGDVESDSFFCSTDVVFGEYSPNMKNFRIWVFFNKESQKKELKKIVSNKKEYMIKVGNYFIIEYLSTGTDGFFENDIKIIDKFPGVLYKN